MIVVTDKGIRNINSLATRIRKGLPSSVEAMEFLLAGAILHLRPETEKQVIDQLKPADKALGEEVYDLMEAEGWIKDTNSD